MGNRTVQHLVVIGQKPDEPGRALKYDPAHCDTVKALAQVGQFPEEWAAHIGVTFQTFRNWIGAYPEFREAMVTARHLLAAYWSKEAREKLTHPTLKTGVLDRILTRRIGDLWADDAPDLWAALGLTGAEEVADPHERARALDDKGLADRLAALDRLKARREAEGDA